MILIEEVEGATVVRGFEVMNEIDTVPALKLHEDESVSEVWKRH